MADVADLMDLRARQMQVEKWLTVPQFRFDFHLEPKPKAPARKKPAQAAGKAPASKKNPAAKKEPAPGQQKPKQQKPRPKQ